MKIKKNEITWKYCKTEKPKHYTNALVCNEKGWMFQVQAMYNADQDVWILYDPNYRQTILLDVTHYLPIPLLPIAIKRPIDPKKAKE